MLLHNYTPFYKFLFGNYIILSLLFWRVGSDYGVGDGLPGNIPYISSSFIFITF